MLAYMARRIAWSALVLVLVAATAFTMIHGGLVVGVTLGFLGGAFCATRRDTLAARALEAFAMNVLCTPVYLVGLSSLLLFSPDFGYVPLPFFFNPHVYEPIGDNPWNWLRSLVVPWLVVGGPLAAMVLRMTRSAIVDALHDDYMRTALAKGLTHRRAVRRHGSRARTHRWRR